MITLEEVTAAVADILKNSSDAETAHVLEDALHNKVLQAIASGESNPSVLAAAALKTREIRFPRWYA